MLHWFILVVYIPLSDGKILNIECHEENIFAVYLSIFIDRLRDTREIKDLQLLVNAVRANDDFTDDFLQSIKDEGDTRLTITSTLKATKRVPRIFNTSYLALIINNSRSVSISIICRAYTITF